jgi:hypothetical protein
MVYFLENIAKSLHSEFGNSLNRHCLVFPGRRAGLFFLKYLAADLKKPVWAPAIMTINDLFRAYSKLQPAENEILLFELYRIYRSITGTQESFDDFYFWGDMLLNDFDDIDKYLADASKVFRNVSDLKMIDQQFGGLTPEQGEIIRQFWISFNPEKQSKEKSRFIGMWSKLNEIYSGFKKNLLARNLAYEGMIFRDVTENHLWNRADGSDWEMVHFIGFNALNECEKAMMTALRTERRARFYWDYDNSYMTPGKLNSAGFFLKDNIKYFGNDMPPGWSYDTLLSGKQTIVKRKVIDTSSDIAQVKLISGLIKNLPELTPSNAHQTAVVLADENLLVPVLTSLPEDFSDVNITMGFPLRQTQVYSLIRDLLEMQDNAVISGGEISYSFRDVIKILKNSLISVLMEESDREIINEITEKNLIRIQAQRFSQNKSLAEIFRKPSTIEEVADYLKSVLQLLVTDSEKKENRKLNEILPVNIRNEFIFRVLLSINRLRSITEQTEIPISLKTWTKILDRLLRSQWVPFAGEPLTGIQIMGILETRALDFRNLILLSVNEGILPSVTGAASFIPFSLREAFGLPSLNHRESVYAYHFYRLLHRAENVTFVYNSNPEDMKSGEMSRFLQQMKYEPAQVPEFLDLNFEIRNPVAIGKVVEKSDEHIQALLSRFCGCRGEKKLSPLAINTWLGCRMRFYYRYVNGLKEPDRIREEIDPAMLGIMFHECIKGLYAGFIGKKVSAEVIDVIMADKKRQADLISGAIRERYQREGWQAAAINEMIAGNVLQVYISRILEIDRNFVPFTILALEDPVDFPLEYNEGRTITIGGAADRVDVKDSVTRIVDYKTGTTTDSLTSLDILFRDDRNKDADGWLQTLLYCEGYLVKNTGVTVRPSIYKVKKIPAESTNDKLLIKTSKKEGFFLEDFESVRKEFLNGVSGVVKAIFSRDEHFIMTSKLRSKCSYCPYSVLCMRQ